MEVVVVVLIVTAVVTTMVVIMTDGVTPRMVKMRWNADGEDVVARLVGCGCRIGKILTIGRSEHE